MIDHLDHFTVIFTALLGLLFFFFSELLAGKKNFHWKFFTFHFLALLIVAYALTIFELLLKITSFSGGALLGTLLWLGFIFPLGLILHKPQENSWKNFLLEELKLFIALCLMSSVIAG